MTFTIHRGTHKIGGVCVEVCTERTRVVIDCGIPLVNEDGTNFKQKRLNTLPIHELRERNVLPDIAALYDKTTDKRTAIFISHAHLDHYGLLNFFKKGIPVYLGKITHKFIEMTGIFTGNIMEIKFPRYIENQEPIIWGDIEIIPYLMDHSIPDAYSFLIKADGKTLLYSGDFRAHGREWRRFYKFLNIVPKNVDYLLLEGTTISRKEQKFMSETQLENIFVKTFSDNKCINLVCTTGDNIDRIISVFRACHRSGKIFLVDIYIAIILTELHNLGLNIPYPSDDYPEIKVIPPNEDTTHRLGKSNNGFLLKYCIFEISKGNIIKHANNIVMAVLPTMYENFDKFISKKKCNIIFSLGAWYKCQPSIDIFHSTDIHTSGHANIETLIKYVNELMPKNIIPIHTDSADKYKDLFHDSFVLELNDKEKYSENEPQNIS